MEPSVVFAGDEYDPISSFGEKRQLLSRFGVRHGRCHTSPIPGLFRAVRAAMAEELDWEQEAFDKAFREVFMQGMAKADWKALVASGLPPAPQASTLPPPAN